MRIPMLCRRLTAGAVALATLWSCASSDTVDRDHGRGFRLMLADGSEAVGLWMRREVVVGRHPALMIWFEGERDFPTITVDEREWLERFRSWSQEGRSLVFVWGRSASPVGPKEDARALWEAMTEDPRVDAARSRMIMTFRDRPIEGFAQALPKDASWSAE